MTDCCLTHGPSRFFSVAKPGRVAFNLLIVVALGIAAADSSSAQSGADATWTVSLVLPAKMIAGRPATLAVFGADGKLASGVTVEIAQDQRVTTDTTGRALFTAPPEGSFLIAKSSGRGTAALVDTENAAADSKTISVAPVISVKDSFAICGGGFRGEADANRVKINEERALVLAASPECLVVSPGPKAAPGPATISVQCGDARWTVRTTLVSLIFEPPQPALMPDKRSKLTVRAEGAAQPLWILVENQTPGILGFLRGDAQELRTSGGTNNFTAIEVKAIRSGDFSFRARLIPASDPAIAERYLRAAGGLGRNEVQRKLNSLADRLARHPRDAEKIQREVERIISTTITGDVRTLLESAAAAL